MMGTENSEVYQRNIEIINLQIKGLWYCRLFHSPYQLKAVRARSYGLYDMDYTNLVCSFIFF